MTVAVTGLAQRIFDRLETAAGINVFDGEPVLPAYNPADQETWPFWDVFDDGLLDSVHAYAAFYPSPGWARAILLPAAPDTIDETFQVTCVGGDRARTLACADAVRAVLSGWMVADDNGQLVAVTEVAGVRPLFPDPNMHPPALYTPLLFTVIA